MPPNRTPTRTPLTTGLAANGVSSAVNIRDFKNVQIQLATTGTASLTVKIQGSLSETVPDFSTSASATNHWTYVACFDLIDPTTVIAGGTGISTVATDLVKNLLVNIDGMNWLSVEVSGRSAGTLIATAVMYANQ